MLKKSLLLLATSTILFSQSTMCYKENHTSPSTIETIKLNGGECKSSKSVQDMKNNGWTISNISMNPGNSGMNYMYVFSKGSNVSSMMTSTLTKEDIKKEMRAIAKEEKVALEKARVKKEQAQGKAIYNSTCSKCHGQYGEIAAYNKGRKLNAMNAEDIEVAMRLYSLNDKDQDHGLARIMKPYADVLLEKETKAVANYIQNLK